MSCMAGIQAQGLLTNLVEACAASRPTRTTFGKKGVLLWASSALWRFPFMMLDARSSAGWLSVVSMCVIFSDEQTTVCRSRPLSATVFPNEVAENKLCKTHAWPWQWQSLYLPHFHLSCAHSQRFHCRVSTARCNRGSESAVCLFARREWGKVSGQQLVLVSIYSTNFPTSTSAKKLLCHCKCLHLCLTVLCA